MKQDAVQLKCLAEEVAVVVIAMNSGLARS